MKVYKMQTRLWMSDEMLAEVTARAEQDRAVLGFLGEAADRAIRRALGELATYVDPDLSVWESEGGAA